MADANRGLAFLDSVAAGHPSVAPVADVAGWAEFQPLSAEHEKAPYPLDALPGAVRQAVEQVIEFTQCPDSIAACSALSALSLAGQPLVDVERSAALAGPSSLYTLAIAESGERKSTVDRLMTKPIREWEARMQESLQPSMAAKRAEFAAWEAKKEAVLLGIKNAKKSGKPTGAFEVELRELEQNEPQPERWPQLLYAETTPEALAWDLSKRSGWQSGGMISSEAGIVFGSHGMNTDSLMRNLALLNSLWDGASHNVNRRTSESFAVRGVRLTMGLAAQPEVVRDFLDRAKVARNIGFIARFLIAWPDSNQGFRRFKEGEPDLSAFHARLSELLSLPFSTDERGGISPALLRMSPEGKAAWVRFYEDIEAELRPGKALSEIRDIASKAADNSARLAALLHLFQHGPTGDIAEAEVVAANRVVGWHLYEARRFLGDVALPRATSDAIRLSEWLGRYCRGEVPASQGKKTATLNKRIARIHGPVRDGDRFEKAMVELVDAGHARLRPEGRAKLLEVAEPLWRAQ